MRTEIRRFGAAIVRPEWFDIRAAVCHQFNSLNFELAQAERAPWSIAGWERSHLMEWFVGFDGQQLRRID
eukprot:10456223-Alexandrium_andersonii.AAC.1